MAVVIINSTSSLQGFTLYNETFDYRLTQATAGNQLLISDNNWFGSKEKLRNAIDSGNQAVVFASDIFNAQLCYDIATRLRLKSRYVFNINS